MSEKAYNQMQWTNKKLIDTSEALFEAKEELDSTRRMNNHLNDALDRLKGQLDDLCSEQMQIKDAIRDSGTMDDIKYIMGWRCEG